MSLAASPQTKAGTNHSEPVRLAKAVAAGNTPAGLVGARATVPFMPLLRSRAPDHHNRIPRPAQVVRPRRPAGSGSKNTTLRAHRLASASASQDLQRHDGRPSAQDDFIPRLFQSRVQVPGRRAAGETAAIIRGCPKPSWAASRRSSPRYFI